MTKTDLSEGIIGKYGIVRTSQNEGVNAGVVERMDDTGIVLSEARRLWGHRPKSTEMCWYEGVAISGLSKDSKISVAVPLKVIVEQYSVTLCTPEAEKSIREHPAHEQT